MRNAQLVRLPDIDEGGRLALFFPDYFVCNLQDMQTEYQPNGAGHFLDVSKYRVARTYFGKLLVAYDRPWTDHSTWTPKRI